MSKKTIKETIKKDLMINEFDIDMIGNKEYSVV